MPDDPAPQPAPAPAPAPMTRADAIKAALTVAVAAAAIGGAMYAYRRMSAAPAPPPAPPAAVLSGSAMGTTAGEAMYLLDASGSTSDGPIAWKVKGGEATVMPMTPPGKPGGSVAIARVPDRDPRTFIAVATGAGTADADVWTTPGAAPPPGPGPQSATFKGEIDTTYVDGVVTGIQITPSK